MKVIDAGNSKKKWTKIIICPHCHAKLEIEKKDLCVDNDAVAYAGETWEPHLRCKCGACGSRIEMEGKVPEGIEEELINKARRRNS
jgi:uncharacterized protein YbaR (Trm112 family)